MKEQDILEWFKNEFVKTLTDEEVAILMYLYDQRETKLTQEELDFIRSTALPHFKSKLNK